MFRSSMPFELEQTSAHDMRVIAFTAAVAVGTGLLFGLLPALRAAGRGEAALREMSATTTGARQAARGTRMLVALQVAICLALLVTAGLLTQSLRNVRAYDPGFSSKGLVLARLDTRLRGYDRARAVAYYDALEARLRAIDGVRAVSIASVVPLGGERERRGFLIPGRTAPDGNPMIRIDYNLVGSGYFETMGIPILRGRGFTGEDTSRSRPVAVINETMARQFWPDGDPIGQRIAIAMTNTGPLEIVGVVRDIKYYAMEEQPRPYVYLFGKQGDGGVGGTLHVRVAGTGDGFAATLRREAAAIDPLVILRDVMTFEELRQQPLAMRTAMTLIATLFGAVALLLTIVGIYGTMTSAVGQRTREIGVRMAFGAGVGDVFRLVLRDGFLPVGAGLALGLAGATTLTRLVAGQLFGVSVRDPLTYGAAVAVVAVTSVVALSLPARWATRVDPVAVLRAQ
jgi:predicted permease